MSAAGRESSTVSDGSDINDWGGWLMVPFHRLVYVILLMRRGGA